MTMNVAARLSGMTRYADSQFTPERGTLCADEPDPANYRSDASSTHGLSAPRSGKGGGQFDRLIKARLNLYNGGKIS